ncbi:RlpA-like double-psi beta-barrel-protein domain-containing protein-containing protein [Clohesyomyces aquaticus]|uniref:RlpA-like double-psi beta-barrel-protein domain-containing protein-containing protein n=1 Tax=Clohesyomyces aquaticus TaxID=1231657 RepID=A0A1Y1XYV1_9PLEO|nr:RlpA-like double-psi beta-barrel-protein domain-containing protein-containing protein [Clohesyomyces aquaticus]
MMKSLLLALPFLGLAAAEFPCNSVGTVTVTYTPTVTVQPSTTAAPVEQSTSATDETVVVTSIIYVTPSPIPYFPNGTLHFNTSSFAPEPVPTTFSFVFATPSASNAPAETSIAALESSSAAAATPSSEAAAAAPSTSPNTASGNAIGGKNSGEATYYGGNVAGGMCSFTGYTIPSGIFGTALSDANWAGAGNCGACLNVTSGKNTITAMVVDQCPGCGTNHLDLFPDAFSTLASPSKGIIPVSWQVVPCGITSPIVLKNKEGTSKYWFSIQVQNANVPVAKLEVSTDGGKTYKATTRKDYNYFENPSGFGVDSVTVKVTSVNGQSVVVGNVGTTAGATFKASGNIN